MVGAYPLCRNLGGYKLIIPSSGEGGVSGLGILMASQITEKGVNGVCTVCAGYET